MIELILEDNFAGQTQIFIQPSFLLNELWELLKPNADQLNA